MWAMVRQLVSFHTTSARARASACAASSLTWPPPSFGSSHTTQLSSPFGNHLKPRAVAALLTTPLDVAKTRMMTQHVDSLGNARQEYTSVRQILRSVYVTEGFAALFAGVLPRVLWISIGGFMFFGAYESSHWALI